MLQASAGTLRLAGNSDSFVLDLDTGLRLDESPESRIRLSGAGQWTPNPLLDLDYAIGGLDPSLLDGRLRGALDSSGAVALAMRNDTLEVKLGIDSLGGQLNGQAVDGRAAVAYANGRTTISDAALSVGENSVAGTARFGKAVQVDAEIDVADLAGIVADAGGSLRGRIVVEGSLAKPEVDVSLQGSGLAWQDYGLAELAVNARLEGDQQGTADITIGGATIASTRIDRAQLVLSGRPDDHVVQTNLQAYGTTLDIEGRGNYAAPAWTADLRRIDIANDEVGTWSTATPGRLKLSPDDSRLLRTCLEPEHGAGQACVSASRDAQAASLAIDIEALPLVALPLALPTGLALDGRVNASLRGELTPQGLAAKAGLTLEDASVSAAYDGELVSLRLETATGKATFIDLFGLDGAKLDLLARWQNSTVVDPVTGEEVVYRMEFRKV